MMKLVHVLMLALALTLSSGCMSLFWTEPPLRKYPTKSTWLYDQRYDKDGNYTGLPYGPGPLNGGGGVPYSNAVAYSGGAYAYPFGGVVSSTGSYPFDLYGLGIVPGVKSARGPFGGSHK